MEWKQCNTEIVWCNVSKNASNVYQLQFMKYTLLLLLYLSSILEVNNRETGYTAPSWLVVDLQNNANNNAEV